MDIGRNSPEYLAGSNGVPIGPDLDSLTESELAAIQQCLGFFRGSADRIRHFTQRVSELGRSGSDTVITLIDVDDQTGNGRILADLLMPNEDWQQYRNRGEVPVARGLAGKNGFPEILEELGYANAANTLASTDALSVVVLCAATVQVMEVKF